MPELRPVEGHPFGVTLVSAGDPFSATLHPVEENPFQSDPYTAAQPPVGYQDPYGRALTGVGQGMVRHFMAPGAAAQGVALETPGRMTEADAYRLNQAEDAAQKFGPAQALNMIGSGTPMARPGTAGIAGGEIPHPPPLPRSYIEAEATAMKAGADLWKEDHPPNTPSSPYFNPDKPTPPEPFPDYWEEAMAQLKEATTAKAMAPKVPDVEFFADKLKPFEWHAETPPLKESLHPQERSTYEQITTNPERSKAAYSAGFNISKPLFKGGYADYPKTIENPATAKGYERGLFLADNPKVAENYGEVAPYLARAEKPHEIDWTESTGDAYYKSSHMHAIVEAGHAKGADLLVIRNILDVGGKQNQYVVLNPAILRAPHAKFDYDKLKHAMPLAGIAGGGAIVLDQDGDIAHYIKGRRP